MHRALYITDLFQLKKSTYSIRALIFVHPFFSEYSELLLLFNFHIEIAYNKIQSLCCVVDQEVLKLFLRLLIKLTYSFTSLGVLPVL